MCPLLYTNTSSYDVGYWVLGSVYHGVQHLSMHCVMGRVHIDANTCTGTTYDNSTAHEWTILKLDEKYYYADPTFENADTGGYGLMYFGITTQEREYAGNYNPQFFNIGSTNEIWARDYDISDTRFAQLRTCLSFEIDHATNSVVCFDENGSEYIMIS